MNTLMNKKFFPWLLLVSRLILFALVQSLFAAGFALAGHPQAWEQGANWWPIGISLANLILLGVLISYYRVQGKRYWDIFRIERNQIKNDLLVMLGLTILCAPVSYLPNVMVGQWLFGDSAATLDLFVRPLPLWAVIVSLVIFPLSQSLVETGTYFGTVMPAFKAQGLNRWAAILLPALFLGLQHLSAPLLWDVRFIIWRAVMYLPFAILIGIFFNWRQRLLPYFAIVHFLMNLSFATMFLDAAIR